VKILVVDDDMDVLMATGFYLYSVEKMQVTKAHGGREGLKAYEMRGPFDIVLTDYSMPDMDGIALSFAIRKLNPTQEIVINTQSHTLAGCMKDYGLADVRVVNKQDGIEAIVKLLRVVVGEL